MLPLQFQESKLGNVTFANCVFNNVGRSSTAFTSVEMTNVYFAGGRFRNINGQATVFNKLGTFWCVRVAMRCMLERRGEVTPACALRRCLSWLQLAHARLTLTCPLHAVLCARVLLLHAFVSPFLSPSPGSLHPPAMWDVLFRDIWWEAGAQVAFRSFAMSGVVFGRNRFFGGLTLTEGDSSVLIFPNCSSGQQQSSEPLPSVETVRLYKLTAKRTKIIGSCAGPVQLAAAQRSAC